VARTNKHFRRIRGKQAAYRQSKTVWNRCALHYKNIQFQDLILHRNKKRGSIFLVAKAAGDKGEIKK